MPVQNIGVWIARSVEPLIRRSARQFPVVLVTGARQTGKTSLLRRLFPRAHYVALDLPAYAEAARTEPASLFGRHPPPVIVDEVQYAPVLLRYVKAWVDRDRRPGRFLLTGSQTFALMQGVSETLAGRVAIVPLHSLGLEEVRAAGLSAAEPDYLWLGGYPGLYAGQAPELWFASYVATYLERDVRNVTRVADLAQFQRFLRACALRSAQVLNYSDLARDTGIAPNTARHWLGLLVTSGIVALAEPYFRNPTTRLIKAPKLHFLDTGLAAFLMGYRRAQELAASPHAGPLWESCVYGQILRRAAARGSAPAPLYWRTAEGHEVDIVIEGPGGMLIAIECKWAEQPGDRDGRGLAAFARAQARATRERMIVCRTPAAYRLADGTRVVDLAHALRRLP